MSLSSILALFIGDVSMSKVVGSVGRLTSSARTRARAIGVSIGSIFEPSLRENKRTGRRSASGVKAVRSMSSGGPKRAGLTGPVRSMISRVDILREVRLEREISFFGFA